MLNNNTDTLNRALGSTKNDLQQVYYPGSAPHQRSALLSNLLSVNHSISSPSKIPGSKTSNMDICTCQYHQQNQHYLDKYHLNKCGNNPGRMLDSAGDTLKQKIGVAGRTIRKLQQLAKMLRSHERSNNLLIYRSRMIC